MTKKETEFFEAFKQLLEEANSSGLAVLHSVLGEEGYHLPEITERSLIVLEREYKTF